MSKGRVTITTIAKDLGVSPASVSLVLRNAYGVSDEMRARVKAAMERLGYQPNAAARAMRGQTYTFGVIVSDIHNQFYSAVMDGVGVQLESSPYQMVLGISGSTVEAERIAIRTFTSHQLDGLILFSPVMTFEELSTIAKGIPIVVVGRHEPDATDFDTVNDDDVAGARLMARHLLETGRTRIAFLNLEDQTTEHHVGLHRQRGYVEVIKQSGGKPILLRASGARASIEATVSKAQGKPQAPDAWMCWSDYAAFEVISALGKKGISVPTDAAVSGYDNTDVGALWQHSLTTVDQSADRLGREAFTLLMERLEGRTTPRHVKFDPTLIVRGSTGGPRKSGGRPK